MAASLNPLHGDGTDLPVNLLLCAKLIALTLLVTNHVRLLTDPFLPFLPILDRIPTRSSSEPCRLCSWLPRWRCCSIAGCVFLR